MPCKRNHGVLIIHPAHQERDAEYRQVHDRAEQFKRDIQPAQLRTNCRHDRHLFKSLRIPWRGRVYENA